MRNYQAIELIVFLSLLFACSDTDSIEPDPKSLSFKIDNYLEQHQSSNVPGLSVAIRHGGAIVYERSKGLARTNNSSAINKDTQFRIGSITKPLTAIAIMKLVEENKISLDDKLSDFLPSLPESFSEITVAHLLSHRSGLIDYINENNNLSSLDNLPTSAVLNIIEGSGLEQLLFEPGTSGDYSNTGYVFLALVIEKVSGRTYPEYLQTEIFEPAQMSNSFVISENQHLGDKGDNYALSFGTNLEVLGFNSLIYGAGGVASTTLDLLRFTEALLNDKIISKSTHARMTKTISALAGLGDYGLGWITGSGSYWHTGKYSDVDDFWHSGGIDGYRSILSISPALDLQVVILTNNGDASQAMIYDIIEIARNHVKEK